MSEMDRAMVAGLYPAWPAWCLRFGRYTLEDVNTVLWQRAEYARRGAAWAEFRRGLDSPGLGGGGVGAPAAGPTGRRPRG